MTTPEPRSWESGAILLAILAVAVTSVFAIVFGLHGFALGVDIGVALLIGASYSGLPSLRPISDRQMTITELSTLVAMCAIFHALAMPAKEFRGRSRAPRETATTEQPAAAEREESFDESR